MSSRTPWHLHCLNPYWSVRVPTLEVSLTGGTEVSAEAGNPPPKGPHRHLWSTATPLGMGMDAVRSTDCPPSLTRGSSLFFPFSFSQSAYSLPVFLPFPLLKTFCIFASLGLGFKNTQRSLTSDHRFEVIHVISPWCSGYTWPWVCEV